MDPSVCRRPATFLAVQLRLLATLASSVPRLSLVGSAFPDPPSLLSVLLLSGSGRHVVTLAKFIIERVRGEELRTVSSPVGGTRDENSCTIVCALSAGTQVDAGGRGGGWWGGSAS